ncbi:MAG: dihydroxyacetone kinase subunit DhaL [Anaerolineae bacterium]|nr:dihydroxyacetone kinase subunit DhaL [Anaerolineae bacterium]
MGRDADLIGAIIEGSAAMIGMNRDLLTRLDQMIGDGDHGTNMCRGMAAVLEESSDIAGLPFEEACRKAGMLLVMTVGGASGPLFGSLIMALGKGRDRMPSNRAELAAMLAAGIEAVKARGKSDVGAKTMLDVLAPVSHYVASADPFSLDGLRRAAAEALEATRPIQATRGRAAFLGPRSIGHIDPGAQTVALLVNSISDALEHRP